MNLLWDGLREAFTLIIRFDPLVLSAAWRSIWISLCAIGLASAAGLPIGTILARVRFPARGLIIILFRGAMALPTVFVGMVGYAMFSRHGPLGSLDLIYTPWAIVVGEFCLATPIIISITHGAIKTLDPRIGETAWTLGAGPFRRWRTYISEARMGIMLALVTAFARCVTELGVAMMVGGNIKGRTRTLATATALETGKGEFARGIAMGLMLLAIALAVTLIIVVISREEKS